MNFKTHLTFGILLGLVALPFVKGIHWIIFFPIVILGALLPDIDHPQSKFGKKLDIFSKLINSLGGHRGITHSLYPLIALPGLIWYLFGLPCGIALFIGYFSHLLIDSINPKGVNFLNPLATWHMRGFIETGSIGEWIVFIILVAGIGLTVFMTYF